jgi:ABC-type transport system involved in cytochrome c biogenesis permease subunit
MSPQTTEQITKVPAPVPAGTDTVSQGQAPAARPTAPSITRPPLGPGFFLLVAAGVAVTGGLVYTAYGMAFGEKTKVEASKDITIPFEANKGLWDRVGRLPVQQDGRIKPFETFAREQMRAIAGRETISKEHPHDPVAAVFSWLMLYERSNNTSQAISHELDCEWEEFPFISCDHFELRERLYHEALGEDAKLTEEQLHGRHIEPSVLRNSQVIKDLIASGRAKRSTNEKAKIEPIEEKAMEVWRRFVLYERIRSGGEVEDGRRRDPEPGEWALVALDKGNHAAWLSLKSLRYYDNPVSVEGGSTNDDPAKEWDKLLHKRRIEDPDYYEGKGDQPLPKEDVKKVLTAFTTAQKAYRARDEEGFSEAVTGLIGTIDEVGKAHNDYPASETLGLERTFNHLNPFRWAWVVSLLAAFLLGGSVFFAGRWTGLTRILYVGGLAAYLGSMAFSTTGFVCRVLIADRPPVSNMYESIIFVAAMTAFFGLVLELVYRRGLIALSGALVSTLGFVLADQLPLTFTPSIQPLNAVLRSNYWLIIHVMTIVSSYAPLALAWGLGNFNLGLIVFAPHRRDLIKTLSMFSYRAIQIGVLLLFTGTMLGGVWAAESWGRFWGWDPKEVWALIAFLCYMIPLHARYVGWVKDFGLAVCSVVCFSAVVWAWYGVNFLMGAGLHNYGFGSGNNTGLTLAVLINLNLVIVAALSYLYHGQLAGLFGGWFGSPRSGGE